MYLSVATTHHPATDLGFLLHKHPGRVHETELPFGKALVFYPEATEARCEAALVLDIDPVGLVRGKGRSEGLLDQYVNDRPYAASSFLAVALGRALRTAMTGSSRERQELAETEIPLEAVVMPLPARGGGERLVRALFEPLGWTVEVEAIEGATRASNETASAPIPSAWLRLNEGATPSRNGRPCVSVEKTRSVGARFVTLPSVCRIRPRATIQRPRSRG